MGIFRRRPPRPASTLDNVPWFSANNPVTVARGAPTPLEWWQRRPAPRVSAHPQPLPYFFHSRPYSRGADAYAPQFGRLFINPIGAGVCSTARMPTISGPGARYQAGFIFFRVQSIPTSVQLNTTVPIETIDALVANGSVGPGYRTTG